MVGMNVTFTNLLKTVLVVASAVFCLVLGFNSFKLLTYEMNLTYFF